MKFAYICSLLLVLSSACVKEGKNTRTAAESTSAVTEKDANTDPATSFHNPAPCQTCHAGVRPAAPHNQDADCFGCHAYPEWASVATTFNHDPAPETCISCHANVRPEPPHPAEGDCVSCHAFPSFGILVGNASFIHTPKPEVCEQCHTRPKTVGLRAYPNQGPPGNFNANDPAALGSGHYVGKDCVSCHETPDEGATAFAFSHSTPKAEFCLPCHFNNGDDEHNNNNTFVLEGFGNCFNCHKNFDKNVNRNWGRANGGDD